MSRGQRTYPFAAQPHDMVQMRARLLVYWESIILSFRRVPNARWGGSSLRRHHLPRQPGVELAAVRGEEAVVLRLRPEPMGKDRLRVRRPGAGRRVSPAAEQPVIAGG